MGRNLSFFASVGVEQVLDVQNGRFGSPTHAHWEQAFLLYNNLFNSGTGMANVRFGLFELEVPVVCMVNSNSPELIIGVSVVQGTIESCSDPHGGTAHRVVLLRPEHEVLQLQKTQKVVFVVERSRGSVVRCALTD